MDKYLKQIRGHWYNRYMRIWIQLHHTYCSEECARVIVHDGSAKLYRNGCPAELEPLAFGTIRIRRMCGTSLCSSSGCSTHGRPSSDQTAGTTRRSAAGSSCSTKKEKHHKGARSSTFGCMGCSFTCGTLGPFHELAFAESCSQLYLIQHELKQWNAFFTDSIYDDGVSFPPTNIQMAWPTV